MSTKSNYGFEFRDEDTFKNKEEDIRKRDLDIQIQLVDFCQFLQEN